MEPPNKSAGDQRKFMKRKVAAPINHLSEKGTATMSVDLGSERSEILGRSAAPFRLQMSASARARWLLVVAVIAIDAVWMLQKGIHLADATNMICAVAGLMFGAAAFSYLGWERLRDIAHAASQMQIFFISIVVLSYLAATLNAPMADNTLAAMDRTLGLDWTAYLALSKDNYSLFYLLRGAYISILPQGILALIYLPLSGQSQKLIECQWAVILTLLVCVAISAVVPAVGTLEHYQTGIETPWLNTVLALRADSIREISLRHVEGIVTFPSFHTAVTVIYTYAMRGNRRVLVGVGYLNIIMLLSIPLYGGHYFVDMIAGAGVAVAAVIGAHKIELRLRRPAE